MIPWKKSADLTNWYNNSSVLHLSADKTANSRNIVKNFKWKTNSTSTTVAKTSISKLVQLLNMAFLI